MSNPHPPLAVGKTSVGAIETEMLRGGQGQPVLVLHGFHNLSPDAEFLRSLTALCDVHAPSLPGFGHTERPDDFDTVYDLVHFVLDLLDSMPSGPVTVIGLSFGGWLALEAAVKAPAKLSRLILVDPLGLKFSDRETADIADIFNLHPDEVLSRSWSDAALGEVDFDAMTDDEIVVYARNRETLCLYGWHPYMYSPQLANWLHRITVPTIAMWGEHDRIVTTGYGEQLVAKIPDARLETIPGAGHHPELEQPESLFSAVAQFLDDSKAD